MFDRQHHLRPNFLSNEEVSNLAVSFKQAQAESPYRFYERIEPHIQLLFGSLNNKGLMEKLHSEAVVDPPAQWLAKMNCIMELIGPNSDFMSKIMSNRDMRVIIKRSAVPKNMLNGEQINEQIKIVDLKKSSQTLTAPLLDWFFMLLATRLFNSSEVERRVTEQILFQQDDIFFSITRSPLLFLLYKYLQHFSGTPEGTRRLFPILQISLMGALTIRTEHFKQAFRSHSLQKNTRSYENYSNIPYRLKYSHLLAIYLMIGTKKEEDLDIYRSYFQSLSQNFQVCSSYSSEPNLRLFIRVWLFFMNRKQSLEVDVIVSLGKANSSDGWYHLYRYDVEQFEGPSKTIEKNRQFYRRVKNNVFRIIQEQENWKPNLAFLHTFQCLLNFDSRQLDKHSSKDVDKHSLIAQKTIERIFQNIGSAAHQHTKVKKLKDYVMVCFDSIFGQKLSEKNIGKNSSFSTNSEVGDWNTDELLTERKKYVSFQERRERSCWEYPLQDEELSILFHIFYFIAKAIDNVIPGKKKQHPRLNLRFLCNLPTLIITIAVILVCLWLFG